MSKLPAVIDSIPKVQQTRSEIARIRAVLDKWEEAMASLEEAMASSEEAMGVSGVTADTLDAIKELMWTVAPTTPAAPESAPANKPNVQIYEEVLRDLGALHATDIYREAKSRGLILKGVGDPKNTVRSSMSTSKRFVNLGGNVWDLTNKGPHRGERAQDDHEAVLVPEFDHMALDQEEYVSHQGLRPG